MMKPALPNLPRTACFFLLLLLPWRAASQDEATPASTRDLFAQAAAAYDANQLQQAETLYQQLIDRGIRSPALDYNMGNVQYRLDRTGKAIAFYHRALHQAPRDPDIRANLQYVQEQTRALSTPQTLASRAAFLTPGEWAALGLSGWWLLFVALALGRYVPTIRYVTRKLVLLALLPSLLGAAGFTTLALDSRTPGFVVTESVEALHAPLPGAEPHFALPAGTRVRSIEQSADWRKVAWQGKQGWIPALSGMTIPGWED